MDDKKFVIQEDKNFCYATFEYNEQTQRVVVLWTAHIEQATRLTSGNVDMAVSLADADTRYANCEIVELDDAEDNYDRAMQVV